MASPNVGQLQFLSRLFGDLLSELMPQSVAVLGCTTGNGFEHIDADVTCQITAIDINPEYLEVLSRRFGEQLPGLHVLCADVADFSLQPESVDLVHCALLLEYVRPDAVIPRAADWLKPGGVLSVVVQLPSHGVSNVSETTFTSLRRLEPVIRLVEPEKVRCIAASAALSEVCSRTEVLASGKSFFVGLYAKGRPENRGSPDTNG